MYLPVENILSATGAGLDLKLNNKDIRQINENKNKIVIYCYSASVSLDWQCVRAVTHTSHDGQPCTMYTSAMSISDLCLFPYQTQQHYKENSPFFWPLKQTSTCCT